MREGERECLVSFINGKGRERERGGEKKFGVLRDIGKIFDFPSPIRKFLKIDKWSRDDQILNIF